MKPADRWTRLRIHLFSGLFVLLFLLVIGRAFQVQIHQRDRFLALAENQREVSVSLPEQRGTIYDANGKELAVSLEAKSVYAHPHKVENIEETAEALAAALDLDSRWVLKKLNSKKRFVWIKRRATPAQSQNVEALDLKGVNATIEHKRYYPASRLGAQVVGFTGIDPNGLEGIELEYDRDILGAKRTLFVQRDGRGGRLASDQGVVKDGARGHDIYLTLDSHLQYVAEKGLKNAVEQNGAKSGHVVIMEVATGRVLAMASQPDYNPNALQSFRPGQWRNRAIADTFEPGSTMKVFLMAAALEEGTVRPSERIDCENGRYLVGGQPIHDHKEYSKLTVAEVLRFSSNIGAAKIGERLGRKRYYGYLTAFGFAHRTGIDLPGEAKGLLRKPNDWFAIDLAAISFGQGLTVSSIQLATALSAIANGGNLMQPYVVDQIKAADGTLVYQQKPKKVRRVISKRVAATVREMMARVVDPGGTGGRAAIEGYRVGGKTGTAQKVDPVTGGYSADKRVASFFGFVPYKNPRLAIVVTIDEPQKSPYGGVVAAPVFARVASQSMSYLQVPVTRMAEKPLVPSPARPKVAISPRTVAALPAESGRAAGKKVMPDFRGLSVRQALQLMERSGLNLRLTGSGKAMKQQPAPYQPLKPNQQAWVKFLPPV